MRLLADEHYKAGPHVDVIIWAAAGLGDTDLPLNFHQRQLESRGGCTPIGTGGATGESTMRDSRFMAAPCWAGFRPGLVTGRIARPVRSRRF